MMNHLMRFALLLCVVGASLSVHAQRQRGQAIRQLVQNVQSAMPRAKLSDNQKSELQSDIDGINAAFQAREQGQSVDRGKLMATIDDIHQVVDSGAFTEDDQKKLDTEFSSISSH